VRLLNEQAGLVHPAMDPGEHCTRYEAEADRERLALSL
jgi:hypothetical protein